MTEQQSFSIFPQNRQLKRRDLTEGSCSPLENCNVKVIPSTCLTNVQPNNSLTVLNKGGETNFHINFDHFVSDSASR